MYSGAKTHIKSAAASDGANGYSLPLPDFCQIIPVIIPNTPENSIKGTIPSIPKNNPATVKNFTSPMPRPSFFFHNQKPYLRAAATITAKNAPEKYDIKSESSK